MTLKSKENTPFLMIASLNIKNKEYKVHRFILLLFFYIQTDLKYSITTP